jgi:nitrite reductase/ring-hydroxylating ferredoxin subunit
MAENGDTWTMVAKADEIPAGSIQHVEFQGVEYSIINLDGRYYAMGDRCGHMNAPLSRGKIATVQGKSVVVCPLHSSTWDVASGRNLTGPVKGAPMDMTSVPKPIVDVLAKSAELAAAIKVHNLPSFDVERRGDEIWLNTAPRDGSP